MVPECIPRQTADLPMILMSVVAPMRKNDIRSDAPLQSLEPRLDLLTLFREKSVPEVHHLDFRARRVVEKVAGRGFGFTLALTSAAENTPVNIETNASIHQAQERCSRPYLNVI